MWRSLAVLALVACDAQATAVPTGVQVPAGLVDITAHGAIGDGVADNCLPVKSALDAATSRLVAVDQGAVVHFPAGRWRTSCGWRIPRGRITITGASWDATQIILGAPGDDVLFDFDPGGAGVINYNEIRDMRLMSFDHDNVAIRTHDVAAFSASRVNIGPWSGVGWRMRGREFISANQVNINAPKPVEILANKHSATGGSNHIFLTESLFIGGAADPVIRIGGGYPLNDVEIRSVVAAKGTHGIEWVDSTSTAQSTGMVITNFRAEQGGDPASYTIKIDKSGGAPLGNLTLTGVRGDIARQGLYLRNVTRSSLRNVSLNMSSTTVDIDQALSFGYAASIFVGPANMGNLVPKLDLGRHGAVTDALGDTGHWAAPSNATENHVNLTGGKVWTHSSTGHSKGHVVDLLGLGDGQLRTLSRISILASDGTTMVHGEIGDQVGGATILSGTQIGLGAFCGQPVCYINNGSNARVQLLLAGGPISLVVVAYFV